MKRMMEQGQMFIGRLVLLLCGIVSFAAAPRLVAQPPGSWAATPTAQQNGARMHLPLDLSVSRRSSLALTVDTRWANNYGYRPVEVTVTSPKPTVADHRVTLRLHSGWDRTMIVEQDIDVPQGSTSATATIAMPQYRSASQTIWWDAWVDGVRDKDLSISEGDIGRKYGGRYGAAVGLTFLTATPVAPGLVSERTLVVPQSSDFEVLSLNIADFPRRWIDYTCLDVVLLSWNELELLSSTNGTAFDAMLRWLRAGGSLWVGEVGSEYDQLGKISKLLRLRASVAFDVRPDPADSAQPATATDSPDVGWQPVRFRNGFREGQVVTFLNLSTGDSRVVRDPDEISRLQNDTNYAITDQQFDHADDDFAERRWPRDSNEWFVEQRFGLGSVRAFREATEVTLFARRTLPTAPAAADGGDPSGRMPRSLATALRSTDRWTVRHGTAPNDVNQDFANLLVPGLGLAPVTEFRVLISLFVLLIGPVNYWLLKRWGRLHLLVLTVPMASGLLAAVLFTYAVVSDGFGTTVRVHSFTSLDQRSGEAACWSRLSYYSGLAPRNGLRMPADIVVYPINPAWNSRRHGLDLDVVRAASWKDDEVKLTRGWLRSRTPTQYLMIRSRRTPHRLDLDAGGGKLRATNRLGTQIMLALVCDREGKFWLGEEIEADSIRFLARTNQVDAIRSFRHLVMANAPEAPAALSDGESQFDVQQRRANQMFGFRFGSRRDDVRVASNAVSERLADLAGLAGGPALELPRRSYVAITNTGPEVEFGVAAAKEEASFHVIVGQW